MARTISQIYNEIVAEKEQMTQLAALQPDPDSSQKLLDDLTSVSKVAVWRLWAFVVATAIWTHEKLWDEFKTEVDAIVEAAVPGTARWYQQQCFLYQHGDEMVYQDYKYQYDPVDADKRIVKRASATEQGGNVLIKVAKETAGNPEKLDPDELLAFKSYFAKIKFIGTTAVIISTDPDRINIAAEVFYDPQLLNSNGELLGDLTQKPVEDAIQDYLKTLPWNGVVLNSAIVDAIQAATGVLDVQLQEVKAKSALASVWQNVTRSYQAVAGYITSNEVNITYTSV